MHTVADFYRDKLGQQLADLAPELGQFNVFRFEDFAGQHAGRVPFSRSDYHKISLLRGRRRIYYPGGIVETGPQALLFSNPQAPYQWEALGPDEAGGCCCVFTPAFLRPFGFGPAYPVVQPGRSPVLDLTPAQAAHVQQLFDRMLAELHADYAYRYDALRLLLLEVVHVALRLLPPPARQPAASAAQRLTTRFLELLERQFPVDNPGHRVLLRSAVDFAAQLGVHVNHLNKALKETTGYTTSDLVAQRVLQEAKLLLRDTDWSVTDVAYALGFREATHFTNFFRKHVARSPTAFRVD